MIPLALERSSCGRVYWIAAMLIAFLAFIAMVNAIIGWDIATIIVVTGVVVNTRVRIAFQKHRRRAIGDFEEIVVTIVARSNRSANDSPLDTDNGGNAVTINAKMA